MDEKMITALMVAIIRQEVVFLHILDKQVWEPSRQDRVITHRTAVLPPEEIGLTVFLRSNQIQIRQIPRIPTRQESRFLAS